MHSKSTYEKLFKRPFDLIISTVALIMLSPLLTVTSLLVRVKLGSPIVFKQKRPGLNEKIFILYKFRTMTNKKDSRGELLPDNERLTNFGKFLRSTSLDELPSLINIIKGDMSIVGPRPLLVEYLERYDEEQKKRHNVKPGLTGLAQINGRNVISWDDKFKLDVKYSKNITFFGDFKIIINTIRKVIMRKDINDRNGEIKEAFKPK